MLISYSCNDIMIKQKGDDYVLSFASGMFNLKYLCSAFIVDLCDGECRVSVSLCNGKGRPFIFGYGDQAREEAELFIAVLENCILNQKGE